MQLKTTVLMVLASVFAISAGAGERYSLDRQEELDSICEMERAKLLVPVRKEAIEECVEQQDEKDRNAERHDRVYCERYFEHYGDGGPRVLPMFYDIPECVEAFNYRRSKHQQF